MSAGSPWELLLEGGQFERERYWEVELVLASWLLPAEVGLGPDPVAAVLLLRRVLPGLRKKRESHCEAPPLAGRNLENGFLILPGRPACSARSHRQPQSSWQEPDAGASQRDGCSAAHPCGRWRGLSPLVHQVPRRAGHSAAGFGPRHFGLHPVPERKAALHHPTRHVFPSPRFPADADRSHDRAMQLRRLPDER